MSCEVRDPPLLEVGREVVDHRDVLREDDHAAVPLEGLVEDLVEDVDLARVGARRQALLDQDRVVADLLEAGQKGEDVDVGDIRGGVPELVRDLLRPELADGLVELPLFADHPAEADVLDLVGEIGEDLVLDPPQGEHREPLPKEVELVVGRVAVFGAEIPLRTEIAGEDQIDHRPEFGEAILQRGARERDAEGRGDLPGGAGGLGARVLDALGLVEDRHLPDPVLELVRRPEEDVVGGEHHDAAVDPGQGPARPVVEVNLEIRGVPV